MSQTEPVKVEVGLADRGYDILIGPGLLSGAGTEIAGRLPGTRAAIITDENVAAAHLETLRAGLEKSGIQAAVITLPAGASGVPELTPTRLKWAANVAELWTLRNLMSASLPTPT